MSAHTPGPWAMRLSDNATPYITHGKCADGSEPGLDDLANRICVMPAEISQSYNSFANARLIAAVPELLEALEGEHQAIDWLMARLIELDPKFLPTKSPVWARLVAGKAAIDKATGSAA